MRQQARTHRHALEQWPVKGAAALQHLDEAVAMLDEHLKGLEGEIAQVLKTGAWAEAAGHLLSISGLGLVTTAWLLVGSVTFTPCAPAEAAVHSVGLAPMEESSGSSVGKRASIGHGGTARVRTAL